MDEPLRSPRCRCYLVPLDLEPPTPLIVPEHPLTLLALAAMSEAFDEADRELEGLRRTIESGEDYGLLAVLKQHEADDA